MSDNWKTEIIKKLPGPATFLFAAFSFFKWTDQNVVAWICLVVAIIALFLVIRFEHYEKIIDRQERQIEFYSDQAMKSSVKASETISDLSMTIASGIGKSGKSYRKESEEQTGIS